ncbi:hypothetical protein N7V09_21330 [Shewanella seohaensis]|nr:hypothetical protein [Shewanella seohaensis]UXM82144.1 hypothetical protein N7V09_21330 [Shewanella seohaensis]
MAAPIFSCELTQGHKHKVIAGMSLRFAAVNAMALVWEEFKAEFAADLASPVAGIICIFTKDAAVLVQPGEDIEAIA